MSKHTPGPWAVENPMGEDIGLWIVQDGLEARQWSCLAIVTDDEDGTARDEGGRFIGRNEQRANARLIAAAPDLLAQLKIAYAHIEHMAAWIGNQNAGYSFEGLGEDQPAIAAAEGVS